MTTPSRPQRRSVLLIAAGFALTMSRAGLGQDEAAKPNRFEAIDDLLLAEIEAKNIGSAVALVARGDRILYLEAFGEAAPDVPMFSDAILRLASVGKAFTATAALILVERGVISLDDAVADYIPEYAKARVAVASDDGKQELADLEREITIRHLLTHTGGLQVAGSEFQRAWDATEAKTTTLDLARRIARIPLRSQPGEAYFYGPYGSSYEVLAAVLELASGNTVEELLHEDVFGPLEMNDSVFWVPEEKLDRLPCLYRRRGGSVVIARQRGDETDRSTFIAGGGGVRSTVLDVWRFGRMLLNEGELDGVRILKRETVRQMTSDQIDSSGEFGWGFGASVRLRQRSDGTGSVGTYEWVGGTGAKFWVDFANDLVAVVITPLVPPGYSRLFGRFEAAVYASLNH